MRPTRLPDGEMTSAPTRTAEPADNLLADVVDQTARRPARAHGIATGVVDSVGKDGAVTVSIASWGLSRIAARSIVPLVAIEAGQSVALGFDDGDPLRPIILGAMLTPAAAPAHEVLLDGERVVLQAAQEIELRCGEAALILSADGRIQLRGTYITSHASATQRILGGSVNFN